MGISASLFYDPCDCKTQTLLRRCVPSEEQLHEQQKRWNDLALFLKDDLSNKTGYEVKTWLQGSYKFHTQIRPVRNYEEFDIDLGVYFVWKGSPEDGKFDSETLKSYVQKSLEIFAKNNPDIKEVGDPKTRCCRLHYKNNFYIDVPCYHLNPQDDSRTLITDHGWETSDPKKIYLWFRDKFDETIREKVRRQIRYFKTWASLKTKQGDGRPSSITLTVLVADAAQEIGQQNLGPDDELFHEITKRIVARLNCNIRVINPVSQTEDLNARLSRDEKEKLIKAFILLSKISERANSSSTQVESAVIWQEAFDHMFPMPSTDTISDELPVIARRNGHSVIHPVISVTATYRNNPSLQRKSTNKIGPIAKGCVINFEVINMHEFPSGAEFNWIVRNEGREAELSNDLGHVVQTNHSASRNSAYSGTHYMDCVVKVSGEIISLRRIPVEISKNTMPARNPPRRKLF